MAYRSRAELTPEAKLTILLGLKADMRARDAAQMSFGRALTEAMRAGLSRDDIAEALHVGAGSISRWAQQGKSPRAAA